MATVSYYISSNEIREKFLKGADDASKVKVLNQQEKHHPLFNFPRAPSFFEQLNSIKPIDLGMAVPYVSLKIIDNTGAALVDLNVGFFFKGRDQEAITQNIRNSDRPILSLKSLDIKTTNASGYLYYIDVDLALKVHAANFLSNGVATSLIVPNTPLELEYGWKVPSNLDHPLQGAVEFLRFSVVTYDLTFDETNQIDLTLHGKAFNDLFNNLYISETIENSKGSELSSENEKSGMAHQKQLRELSEAYIRNVARRGGDANFSLDLLKALTVSYKNTEKKTRGELSKAFFNNKKQLLLDSPKKLSNQVTFHDIIYFLLDKTFNDFSKEIVPGFDEFRIIYGDFNDKAGNYANKSLAQFPFSVEDLNSMISKDVQEGKRVPTVKTFLDNLIKNFLEDEEIFKENLSGETLFNTPHIIAHFTNRRIRENGVIKNILELFFVDIKGNLPTTTSLTRGQKPEDLLVLETGHANSFVKKMSLSQISDQQMKAVYISRQAESRKGEPGKKGPKEDQASKENIKARAISPIALPLEGKLTVLGHPEWKPFRAFYLSTGLFLVDAVYRITEVSHHIDASGFTTNLSIKYN